MHISFGAFLRKRRQHLNIMRQVDLAAMTSVSRDTIALYESGKANTARIKPGNIASLAEALDIDRDLLQRWAHSNRVPSEAPELGSMCAPYTEEDLALSSRTVLAVLWHCGIVEALLERGERDAHVIDKLLSIEQISGKPLSKDVCLLLINNYRVQEPAGG